MFSPFSRTNHTQKHIRTKAGYEKPIISLFWKVYILIEYLDISWFIYVNDLTGGIFILNESKTSQRIFL